MDLSTVSTGYPTLPTRNHKCIFHLAVGGLTAGFRAELVKCQPTKGMLHQTVVWVSLQHPAGVGAGYVRWVCVKCRVERKVQRWQGPEVGEGGGEEWGLNWGWT